MMYDHLLTFLFGFIQEIRLFHRSLYVFFLSVWHATTIRHMDGLCKSNLDAKQHKIYSWQNLNRNSFHMLLNYLYIFRRQKANFNEIAKRKGGNEIWIKTKWTYWIRQWSHVCWDAIMYYQNNLFLKKKNDFGLIERLCRVFRFELTKHSVLHKIFMKNGFL